MTPRCSLILRFLAGITAVTWLSVMWGCAPRPVQPPVQDPPVVEAPAPDPAERIAARVKELESDADAVMKSGALKEAFDLYDQALILDPPPPHRQRIMDKVDQLLARAPSHLIEAFLETPGPTVPEALLQYWLGVNLAQETAYTEALSALARFTDLWPGHPRVPDAQDLMTMIRQTLFKKDTIGCLLPLSGKYAVYGDKALKGIQLALQDLAAVHNRKFNMIIKDTQGDPDIAAACVEELDQARVAGILGPLLTVDAAGARALELKIPLIALTQKQHFALSGEYLFSNFLTPRMQVQTLAAYVVRSLGLEKVAVLYPDEPYGRRHMALFSQAVTEYGGKLMGTQAYDGTRTDITDVISRFTRPVKHPLEPSDGDLDSSEKESSDRITFDFEALFIPDSASRVNMILPQLAFTDIRDIVLLGTNLWHHPSLLDQTKGFNQNTFITEGYFKHSRKPATVRFNTAFMHLYGESPGFLEAIFYDTVQILLSTVMDPSVDSREGLKDALLEERIFEGATGRTLFDKTGAARKELFLITIKNNRFVEFDR